MIEKVKSWFMRHRLRSEDSGGTSPEATRSDPYAADPKKWDVTNHAIRLSRSIRNDGTETRPPAIFLHGVMPRCGSVYVGNLIKLHPDIEAYPNQLWEWPFLSTVKQLEDFKDHFFNSYSLLDGKLGQHDFLAMMGAVSIRYLYSLISPGKRLFMKEPRAEFLGRFFDMFPDESLVLLNRDGRDVVNSTVRTWPEHDFESTCQRWKSSALLLNRLQQKQNDRVVYAKFEDVVLAPGQFVARICKQLGLDQDLFPLDQIENIPLQGSSTQKTEGNVSWDPVEKPTGFNPVGRWHDWDDNKKRVFKRIAGDALIETGYAENLDW